MIQVSELISAEALRRYDDNGDPVYSTTERILLALRWFGWVTARCLFDALELDPRDHRLRATYSMALARLVERGRAVCADVEGVRQYRLTAYRAAPRIEHCIDCAAPREGLTQRCAQHNEANRQRARSLYARRQLQSVG